jgi:hypothetical protein
MKKPVAIIHDYILEWVGLRAGLGLSEKKKKPHFPPEFEPRTIQPVP